jgi:hypothetical protein
LKALVAAVCSSTAVLTEFLPGSVHQQTLWAYISGVQIWQSYEIFDPAGSFHGPIRRRQTRQKPANLQQLIVILTIQCVAPLQVFVQAISPAVKGGLHALLEPTICL